MKTTKIIQFLIINIVAAAGAAVASAEACMPYDHVLQGATNPTKFPVKGCAMSRALDFHGKMPSTRSGGSVVPDTDCNVHLVRFNCVHTEENGGGTFTIWNMTNLDTLDMTPDCNLLNRSDAQGNVSDGFSPVQQVACPNLISHILAVAPISALPVFFTNPASRATTRTLDPNAPAEPLVGEKIFTEGAVLEDFKDLKSLSDSLAPVQN